MVTVYLIDHHNTQAGIGTSTCNTSILRNKLVNYIQQCTEVLPNYFYNNNNTYLRNQNLQQQVDYKTQAISLTIDMYIVFYKD